VVDGCEVALDIMSLRFGAIDDGAIEFSTTGAGLEAVERVAA
jgi:hypothetical protein